MRVIGYHITKDLAANSDGEIAISDPLGFITTDKPNSIKVFYHLDYSVANLMSWLGTEKHELSKLIRTQDLYIAPWRFSYMAKKYFNLKYGGGRDAPFANFSDMYQFHRNSDLTMCTPIEYARMGQEIGQKVYDTLCGLDIAPVSLTSPVRCWEKAVLEQMNLPGMNNLPLPAAQMAYKTCDGGWVESFQKGHWDKVYDWDIRSAYASFTRNLLDTRRGRWIQTDLYDPQAYYGYALCDVEITAPFSPISFKVGEDEITPVGKWQRYLTKHHIDFIRKYNLGTVDILDGWWWFPDKLVTPLERMIDELYQAKESAKTEFEKGVIKRILAGTWGKFLQVNQHPRKGDDPFGKLFNPVWAAEVEALCRLKTASLVLDNHLEKTVLHVAVDGVLTSQNVVLTEKGKMGEWHLSGQGKGFVLSSGICALESKDMPLEKENNRDSGDFVLRYGWLKDQITTAPNATAYVLSKALANNDPKGRAA